MAEARRAKRIQRAVRARLLMLASMLSPNPIYPSFGWASGTPIDRHYIHAFLEANAEAVRGRVLEIGDREYTTTYGGMRVTDSDVLSAVATDDPHTIVADLSHAPVLTDDTYDCVILTQTLHYIFDMPKALAEVHRVLKPGGTLLVTVPGISQISTWDMERWGDRWRLTDLSMRELLGTCFRPEEVDVHTYGNAAAAVAFLEGIPSEKLPRRVLDRTNPEYQVLVAARARK